MIRRLLAVLAAALALPFALASTASGAVVARPSVCNRHWPCPSPSPTTTSPSPEPSPTATETVTPTPTVTDTPTPPPTTTAPAAGSLRDSKALIYGSEVAVWDAVGTPATTALAESSGIPAKTREAGIPVIRAWLYDCFTDMTCGTDNHAGTIAPATWRQIITGITVTDGAVPWIKMVPVAADTFGYPTAIDGAVFCPPWTGDAAGNLPFYQRMLDEVKAAGYTGPIIVESNNEMEYACWRTWQAQGAPITSAGSVGVSKRIGEHYAATMPLLKAYARSLGFTEVVVGGYLGVSGGPGWGQTCTADATGPYGYACGYQARWVDEFNTAVHSAYLTAGSDPDYVPDFLSVHAYIHGPDFTSTSGYEFDDDIAYAYFRNWIVQSRARTDAVWGAAVGDGILFSVSEWNAGVSGSDMWSGWTTAGRPGRFYDGWYDMLRGDGTTTGTGTRYWNANVFGIAINSDTGSGRYYNIIRRDGTVPDWYANFAAKSTGDPLRG